MFDQKQSTFILECDQKEIIDELTDEEAGIIFKAIYEYKITKKVPDLKKTLKIVFKQFKLRLDFYEKKYEEKCKKNKENSHNYWRKSNNSKQDRTISNDIDRYQTISIENVNDNMNENENENVSVNDIDIENDMCNQATPDNNSRASHDHTPSIFVEIVACFNRVGIVEDHFQKNKIEFHFKNTKQTQMLIQNVLDRGYTKEDVFDVIFLKYDQWIENKENNKIDMSQYYRPSTILGEKFDEYFEEAKAKGIS